MMTYDNERLLIERLAEINCSILGVSTMLHSVANSLYIMSAQNRGEWEDCSIGWICSVCERASTSNYPFCPNCGAKMEGEAE